MKDPYSTLGIKKDADKKEIKSAYRKLAQKYHPDKNPDDAAAEDKFKEVAGAYEMLSDDSKRAEYDQFGFGGPPRGGFGGFNVSDIFSQFHGGFRPRGPRRGKDLQQSITISFMEAALGTEKKIKVELLKKCDKCAGSGAKSPEDVKQCDICSGSGRQGVEMHGMRYATQCNACQGRGKTISKKCKKCVGAGENKHTNTLKVNVPAGVDNGMSIRLHGKGLEGPAGPGDLYLSIRVAPHPKLTRDGLNVVSVHDVSYLDAILGSKLLVDTIHGEVIITIPPGTQPDTVLRVSKKGVVGAQATGSHLVGVKVSIPSEVSDEHRELLLKIKGSG